MLIISYYHACPVTFLQWECKRYTGNKGKNNPHAANELLYCCYIINNLTASKLQKHFECTLQSLTAHSFSFILFSFHLSAIHYIVILFINLKTYSLLTPVPFELQKQNEWNGQIMKYGKKFPKIDVDGGKPNVWVVIPQGYRLRALRPC